MKIYNTLTNKKEEFVPIEKDKVNRNFMRRKASRTSLQDVRNAELQRKTQNASFIRLFAQNAARKQRFPLFPRTISPFIAVNVLKK